MMITKNIIIILINGILFFACNSIPTNNTSEKQKHVVKTDSSLLLAHIDSLSIVTFPYRSEFHDRMDPYICLSEFKNKSLFNLKYKRIPTLIEGGAIDNDISDSTFNLVSKNFTAKWNLIKKLSNYFVVEILDEHVYLVTISYKLNLIDAIRSGSTDGNVHWHVRRHSVINQDLTILLQHEFEVQIDDKYNFEKTSSEEIWYIDEKGYFKRKN